MALFNRVVAGLQRLFPASGTSRHSPNELSDNVQLVHPFPSQASNLQSSSRVSFTGAPALSPVLVVGPQTDVTSDDPSGGTPHINAQVFDEWMYMHIGHTAAAGVIPRLRMTLVDPAGAAIVIGEFMFDSAVIPFFPCYSTAVRTGAAVEWIFPPRPVLVPPGWQIQILGDAQAVAYLITLAGLVARRSLADVPLWR